MVRRDHDLDMGVAVLVAVLGGSHGCGMVHNEAGMAHA